MQVPTKFSQAECLPVFHSMVDTVVPKQTFVPVGCSFCCDCVSNVKYCRSEVKALSLHLAQPSQAMVAHAKPLLAGFDAQSSGQAQLDAWSQRMFPALHFSALLQTLSLPFLSVLTLLVRKFLSICQSSSHLGKLSVDQSFVCSCTSPGAHPAVHLQPRSSWWNQEQPFWLGAQVYTIKTLPPSCYRAGKQNTGFIYNLPRVETKRSDPLLLKISQATQEEKWYLVVVKGSELHNNFMLC